MAIDFFSQESEREIKVFISHKKEDRPIALYVVNYLQQRGLHAYIDILDGGINATNVTERIVANLRDSTHLIVIYSDNTKYSEWVPFELGVGYERNEGIGVLKCNLTGSPPSYLNAFPVMNNEEDLNKFISLCKNGALWYFSESKDECVDDQHGYAKRFITDLKADLIRGKYGY